MLNEEDATRLLESRHDVEVLADPSSLVASPDFQPSVVASRDELAGARAELVDKASANARDLSETDAERANAHMTLEFAVDYYDYFRRRAQNLLLETAPGVRLTPEETHRRGRLFNRYFNMSRTALSGQSIDKQIEVLQALKQGFKGEPELQQLIDDDAPFNEAVEAAADGAKNLQREIREDLLATRELRRAREAFDRLHRSHVQLVESLLTRQGRSDEAGRFIKRRDPAYAARRRARAPIHDEPEAPEIESEVLEDEDAPSLV